MNLFVDNVSATISYDRKTFWTSELRLLTTDWHNDFFPFNKSDVNDILLSWEQARFQGAGL
jgi:hypothetical protein